MKKFKVSGSIKRSNQELISDGTIVDESNFKDKKTFEDLIKSGVLKEIEVVVETTENHDAEIKAALLPVAEHMGVDASGSALEIAEALSEAVESAKLDALKAKAKELNVKITANMKPETIQKRIDAALAGRVISE